MENIIEVQNVYKIYRMGDSEVHALDGIDFTVKKGEFVSVVGRSGSGKSTLMNILGLLDVPTSGKMLLCGKDVQKLSGKALCRIRNRKIGFIFQGFNLIPSLNALENVELPLMYRKISKQNRRKIALEALNSVGLYERRLHKPSQLSGGQMQRVAIARALASKPPIILADEPTGNLDSKSGGEIMDILLSLNESGKTIVLITHDDKIANLAAKKVEICCGKMVKS